MSAEYRPASAAQVIGERLISEYHTHLIGVRAVSAYPQVRGSNARPVAAAAHHTTAR